MSDDESYDLNLLFRELVDGVNQKEAESFHFPSIAVKAAGVVFLIIRRVAGNGNLGGNAEDDTAFRPISHELDFLIIE